MVKEHTKNCVLQADVLIAGAGIAGLALACLLGKQGVRVHIVDPFSLQKADSKPSGRTVALMVSSLNVLKACNLEENLEFYGCPLEIMRIIDDSMSGAQVIEQDFEAREIGMNHYGMNIPNNFLHNALRTRVQKLDSVTLHIPDKLLEYSSDSHAMALFAKLESGKCIRASLIVGADGRNSIVREIAGIKSYSHQYHQNAITCVINHSRSHNNTATEFHRSSGPMALVPLPGNQSSVVWVERTERADSLLRLSRDSFEQSLQDKTNGILGGISLETNPESWPLCTIRAKSLIAPRVALIAEAAHVMSPITAQGLNLSLRDVATLAETIIDGMRVGLDAGSQALLSSYQNRRLMDVKTRVLGVDAMNRIVSNDILPVQDLRRAGLKIVAKFPALKAFAMHHGLAPSLDKGRLLQGLPL